MHLKRVLVEQVGQFLTIVTGLGERVVLTAVLLRVWGQSTFELWAVCLAVAGFVSLFEFGFSLYFNNRLMEETERRTPHLAARTLSAANALCATVACLGGITVISYAVFSSTSGVRGHDAATLTVVVLVAGSALRVSATGMLSLYRANREYGRLVLLLAAGEAGRVTAAIAVSLAGGGLLAVALTATVTASTLQVVVPVVGALRRFHPHRIAFRVPTWEEFRPMLATSSGFFAQMIPITLLTSLPILYLSTDGLGAGLLAVFVLMRTLSGVPRALLQQFGVVLGQECGRSIAVRHEQHVARIVSESARLYAVVSGMASGLLLGAGGPITQLWTGSASYFRVEYLLAAVAPMILGAFAVMAHNILTTTNAPFFATAGRWVQAALTVVCFLMVPVGDPGLAMLIALSFGELLGYVPLAYLGVARLVPATNVAFHAREILVTVLAAAAATLATSGILFAIGTNTRTTLVLALGAAVIVNATCIPYVGVRQETRRRILQQLKQLIYPRLSTLNAAFRRASHG